jgi:hypothetical protein
MPRQRLRSKWFLWFLLDYYLVYLFVSSNDHCFQQTCRTMSPSRELIILAREQVNVAHDGWGECGFNVGGGIWRGFSHPRCLWCMCSTCPR